MIGDVRMGKVLTLKEDWTFHYESEPIQVLWEKGSIFKIVGGQVKSGNEIIVELEDEDSRYISISNIDGNGIFEERQVSTVKVQSAQIPLF